MQWVQQRLVDAKEWPRVSLRKTLCAIWKAGVENNPIQERGNKVGGLGRSIFVQDKEPLSQYAAV